MHPSYALIKRAATSPPSDHSSQSPHVSLNRPPGRDGRTKVTILGMPRGLAVLISTILALVMVQRGRGILRGLLGLVVGLGLIVGHASLRNPNLKARLSNARDEFRAVWRNAQFHDYTL